ncbi:YesL family protein [Gracilibacillus salinarum]|uniref:DUF624 domain-containing protein n=1 Tax=Gracilibacillus salinarum TaxID=2932255 RepID=A0ABY4GGZ3_9BACI|nr:DUF624 domain-containing protein [Gracilibacillus salinarum]UOQ83414.1 DUF624 domain-containing protein [Gracilibacillus salinarum]
MKESVILVGCNWVVRLAYINVLWCVFTMLGGIIFGWAPATVSSFTIMRRWMEKEEFRILPYFWKIYKKEFLQANASGLINLVIFIILLTNLLILSNTSSLLTPVFIIGNWSLFLLFTIFMLIFYVVYTFVEGSTLLKYQQALFFSISRLPISLLILLVNASWVWILFQFPGLILLFSVSVSLLFTFVLARFSWLNMIANYYKGSAI